MGIFLFCGKRLAQRFGKFFKSLGQDIQRRDILFFAKMPLYRYDGHEECI